MKKVFAFLLVLSLCLQMTGNCFATESAQTKSRFLHYVPYDEGSSAFISNTEDIIKIDGNTYRRLQIAQPYYHGLTHGDVIFIDKDGYLVYDKDLLQKLSYVSLITVICNYEYYSFIQSRQRISDGASIIEDVGNKLIEDTLSSVIINNFKGMWAACNGNAVDWGMSYIDMIEEAGENTSAYIITVSMLYDLMMTATQSTNSLFAYVDSVERNKYGMSYEQALEIEKKFREGYADLMSCEYYLKLIAKDVLGGEANSEVDALDVFMTIGTDVMEADLDLVLEEIYGANFLDALDAVENVQEATDKLNTLLEVEQVHDAYWKAYYPGYLNLEKEVVEQNRFYRILENVSEITGIEYENSGNMGLTDDHIAADCSAAIEDGVYTIKNFESGKMMNVYAGKNSDGTNVVTWQFDGTTDQQFYIEHVGNGQYVIYTVCSSNGKGGFSRCIDIYTGSVNNLPKSGDNVDIYERAEKWDKSQLFYIVPFEDGTVVFESCAVPGLVITADKPGSNNGNISVRKYTNSSEQYWNICNTGGISFEVANNDGFENYYINIGDYAEDMVGVAQTQLGYIELSVVSEIPLYNGEGIWYTKYGHRFNNSSGAWCAFFVMWCAEQAGIPRTVVPQAQAYGKCSTMANWFRNNGFWRDADYVPMPGDIIFFDWDDDGLPNHVGIVEWVNEDGSIQTIEGNVSADYNMQPEESGFYRVANVLREEDICGYAAISFHFDYYTNAIAITGGKTAGKAYMLPDSNSKSVWHVDKEDRCVVLCRDNDYYLLLYPFLSTGKYVAAYVPSDIISVFLEPYTYIPDAEEFYSVNKTVLLRNDTTLFHNPSTQSLMNGSVDARIRAQLSENTAVNVLFAYNAFYFVTAQNQSGFVPIEAIDLTYTAEPENPDTEEPDVPPDTEPDTPDVSKPPEEPEENILAGDVDGNGRITENDGLLVLQFVAGLYKLSETEQKAADADQNGVVNVADAAIIFITIKKMEV